LQGVLISRQLLLTIIMTKPPIEAAFLCLQDFYRGFRLALESTVLSSDRQATATIVGEE
jgi:hypothetical protein